METGDILLLGVFSAIGFGVYKYMTGQASAAVPLTPAPTQTLPYGYGPPDSTTPYNPPVNVPPQTYYPMNPGEPLVYPQSIPAGATYGPHTVSVNGEAFIRSNEGLRLTKYKDGTGYSIGYGHQIKSGDNLPATITEATAERLFQNDLHAAEDAVNAAVRVPITQSQFDSLVDFCYNVGPTKFKSSTLLKNLNASNYSSAQRQFAQWHTPPGVIGRRTLESQMFGTNIPMV